MLNCTEATRLFSESQERKLDFKERMSLKMHSTMCSGCRNFGEQMKALRLTARAYAKSEGDGTERNTKTDKE